MTGAKLVATCDAGRRELPGGWVAVTGGLISGIGAAADPVPDAHLYVAPRRGGDLWSAEIAAAREVGLRFHPTRGSMTLSVKDGGLPPDSVVQDDDEVLADSERLVSSHHDPGWGPWYGWRSARALCSASVPNSCGAWPN